MSKIKRMFSNWRILLYLIVFFLTLLAIGPNPWNTGVAIRTVTTNTSAYNAGMHSPEPTEVPMSRERIVEINRIPIESVIDFENVIDALPENVTVTIKTQKTKFGFFHDENNYFINYISKDNLGLKVYEAPQSNILLGLDLQGGTRVVLQPEVEVSSEDIDVIKTNMERRLNNTLCAMVCA